MLSTRGQRRPLRFWVLRTLFGGSVVFAVLALVLVAMAWRAMGKGPSGARSARMKASANSADSVFVNTQPLWNDMWGGLTGAAQMSPDAEAHSLIPVRKDTAERLLEPAGALRITWLGHSTTLVELGGKRVLTDPVFGDSPFPIPSLGPQRWYPPPLPLDALRDVDLVLISHDHYDHLDQPTIEKMVAWDAPFVVPLGVGAHLEYWGIDPKRIVELDWWQEHRLGDLTVVCTPARHASGRQVFDQMRTLWAGYALIGPERRVFFSGDTGLFDGMTTIGQRYGPFDVVMMEVGAYNPAWPDWHIGPEQAVRAHGMLRGKLLLPIHWGLFNLAMHGWTEPLERVWVEATRQGVDFLTPRPGEVIHPDNPPAPHRWWPSAHWLKAEQDPIVATKSGNPDDRYTED